MAFGVFFSILVIAALLSSCGEIVMRVRLTRRATHDRMAWWKRGGDEVAASYEQLFPDSLWPRYRRFLFWIVLAIGLAVCAVISAASWLFGGKNN